MERAFGAVTAFSYRINSSGKDSASGNVRISVSEQGQRQVTAAATGCSTGVGGRHIRNLKSAI
jgi:hypothetical protein